MIIFLRHGQAENNTKKILAGRSPGVNLTADVTVPLDVDELIYLTYLLL